MKFSHLAAFCFAFAIGTAYAAANKVVLYTSNNIDTINVVIDGFKTKHPEIEVTHVRAGTGATMKRIKAEAKNPLGDIFWSGGLSTINQFTDYQEPYINAENKAVASKFKDPKGYWMGTNMHIAILMVNTKQLPKGAKVPQTWKDLADPVWKGQIIAADPATSGSAYSTFFGIKEIVGEEVFKKIIANLVIGNSSSLAYEGPASGEFAVGITMEYAGCEYVEGGNKNIQLVYPKDGTVTMPEGMFIIKGAKNMEAAKIFYDYLSSKDAQTNLFKHTYRRSIRSDFDASKFAKLPNLKQIKIHDVDPKASGDQRDEFLKQFKSIVRAAKK